MVALLNSEMKELGFMRPHPKISQKLGFLILNKVNNFAKRISYGKT